MSEVRVNARRCDASGGKVGKVKEGRGICAARGNWPSSAGSWLVLAAIVLEVEHDLRRVLFQDLYQEA